MNNPAITVLMTAYNAGGYLDDSIRSVLDQSFGDFEFLIVDDASTDGTAERVQDWASRDRRIRLITESTNRGQTACLNHGLCEARSEWIARQDADDLSDPARLQKLFARAQADPKLALLGSNGWMMDANGQRNGTINVPCGDGAIRWALPFQNPFIHTAVMFRRGAFYDEAFQICQDWELWARLLNTGTAENLPDRLVSYRHHDASLSHVRADRTAAECRQILERMGAKAEEIEPFRRGLRADERAEFWKFYNQHLAASPHRNAAHEAVALHHIQAAGSVMKDSQIAGAAELFAAARADLKVVSRFLRDRLSIS